MKKLFLVGALALFGAMNAQTGHFNLGAHLGMPTGDVADATNFVLGVDAAYMFPVADKFELGITSGYSAFLGKKVDGYKVPTLSLIPVAASAAYKVSPEFSIGADLGYGFLSWDGESDGGFYYQPKLAYSFQDVHSVWLGYQGVSKNGVTFSSVNLGYTYTFGK